MARNTHKRAFEWARKKIYRIYTEDLRRRVVVRAISKKFASFTLQPITGYYAGKAQKSSILEIIGATDSEIKWLAAQIREINQQGSSGHHNWKREKDHLGPGLSNRKAKSRPWSFLTPFYETGVRG